MVVLRGLGQLAFSGRWAAGVLVLGAVAAMSPWCALGAAVGAAAGAAAGRLRRSPVDPEWEAGLTVPNASIVGILWGSAYQTGHAGVGSLVAGLLLAVAIEAASRPLWRHVRLPMLSAPAMAAAYLLAAAHSLTGGSFWHVPAPSPLGDGGVVVAIALVAVAMAGQSRVATLHVAVLVGVTVLAAHGIWSTGIHAPAGLWAFAVAPAAFAIHAVFLAGSAAGGWAAMLAATLAGAVWAIWVSLPAVATVPPLLTPFILAVWVTLAVVARLKGPAFYEPALWRAAEAIREARRHRRPVVALTGAGVSTASGIPDYVSGSWLRPGVPVDTYTFTRFRASAAARRAYWEACAHFLDVARDARPNAGHCALAALAHDGWLTTTITQNVDRLHQAAGAGAVVELHGRIDQVRCLACGWDGAWPPNGAWRDAEARCASCGGLLKPAVIAMEEEIPPDAWAAAEKAAADCGVMIVVGSQLAVSSAVALLARARTAGARIVIVSTGPIVPAMEPGDIVIAEKAEDVLPALAMLLDSDETKSAESDTDHGQPLGIAA